MANFRSLFLCPLNCCEPLFLTVSQWNLSQYITSQTSHLIRDAARRNLYDTQVVRLEPTDWVVPEVMKYSRKYPKSEAVRKANYKKDEKNADSHLVSILCVLCVCIVSK